MQTHHYCAGSQQKAMAKAKAKPAPTQKGAPPATTVMKAAQPQKDPVILPARHQSASGQHSQAVPSLRAELTEVFRQALDTAYPQANIEPVVAQTNEPKFGDYQCNNAMALFGKLKGKVRQFVCAYSMSPKKSIAQCISMKGPREQARSLCGTQLQSKSSCGRLNTLPAHHQIFSFSYMYIIKSKLDIKAHLHSTSTLCPDCMLLCPHCVLPHVQDSKGCLLALQPDAPKNPRAVAEAIVSSLPSADYLAEPPTLAGPGFINVKIANQWMSTRIQTMLKDGIKSWAPRLNRQRVVIDFSSPNVAKEMHVGHLRSTIIGDTISKMLEYCGADVLKLNHVVCHDAACFRVCSETTEISDIWDHS